MNLLQPNTRIGIVAKLFSGKTTLAKLLIDRGFTRMALADAVKDEACWLLNQSIEDYDNRLSNFSVDGRLPKVSLITREMIEQDKTVFRPFLQWLGTDFWRNYMTDPTHWIDIFRAKVETTAGPIVCDDVRFRNEVDALREMGFTIVRLTRNEEDRLKGLDEKVWQQKLVELNVSDVGELSIEQFDVLIKKIRQEIGSMLNHPSEQEVELIQPDLDLKNGFLTDLEWAADKLAAGAKAVC